MPILRAEKLAPLPYPKRFLNLGCGDTFHPDWVNLDQIATSPQVIRANLRQGIPYADASFDVVYHSHFLEHLPRPQAKPFLSECLRVLSAGGILRIVVPDLEDIARSYLQALEHCLQGAPEWKPNYEWITLELVGMLSSEEAIPPIFPFLNQPKLENLEYLRTRLSKKFIEMTREPSKPSSKKNLVSRLLARSVEKIYRLLLSREDYEALHIGRIRLEGNYHKWMYDRWSLPALLTSVGFVNARVVTANQSAIPGWAEFKLDVNSTGAARIPKSLYIEAMKPST